MSRRRPRPDPAPHRLWTLPRASGAGIAAGLAALLVASAMRSWPDELLWPYAGLLLLTVFCGLSILWITAFDMRSRGTTWLMRPIRAFDIVLALVLIVPAGYALHLIRPALGL